MQWICHLYDLDWIDDQHSHGKSVGKYLMVIRINPTLSNAFEYSISKWTAYKKGHFIEEKVAATVPNCIVLLFLMGKTYMCNSLFW